jgi:two-component system NarL family sensor kinase
VGQVLDAEDAGRRRIAQLIHDDTLQTLLAANQELLEAAPGRAQVQRAHEVVGVSIERLRAALMALHPVTLEQGGFELALGAVARQAERQGGFEVELAIESQALGLQDELLLALCRELLTNAARHAEAGSVRLRIAREGDELAVEVADDGQGFSPGRPQEALAEGHLGLASVTERVRSAGGTFAIESSPAGTRGRARIPIG